MKQLGITICIIIPLLLLSSFSSYGQISVKDTEESKIKNAAREIISAAGTSALITLDSTGNPRARAMDAFPPEEDFTIWFGTNSNSRKVKQILNDPRVNIYYFDKELSAYVTIQGIASIVNDQWSKKKYWKKEWEAFYPDKNETYTLIKVKPIWMEVISDTHGIFGDSISWEPIAVDFD